MLDEISFPLFCSWLFFFFFFFYSRLDTKTVFAFISSQKKPEIWQDVLAQIFASSLFSEKWCPANSFWKSLKSSALQADEPLNQILCWCDHNFSPICPFSMSKLNENSTETFRNVSEEAAAAAVFYSDGLWLNSNITSLQLSCVCFQ